MSEPRPERAIEAALMVVFWATRLLLARRVALPVKVIPPRFSRVGAAALPWTWIDARFIAIGAVSLMRLLLLVVLLSSSTVWLAVRVIELTPEKAPEAPLRVT